MFGWMKTVAAKWSLFSFGSHWDPFQVEIVPSNWMGAALTKDYHRREMVPSRETNKIIQLERQMLPKRREFTKSMIGQVSDCHSLREFKWAQIGQIGRTGRRKANV
jgi:hypothetical protein